MTRADCLLTRTLLTPRRAESLSLGEWDTLVRQARAAQLLARLATLIDEHGLLDTVPMQARHHLIAALRLCERQRQAVQWEVGYLLDAFDQVGVPLVLLKGAAYVLAGLPPGRCRIFSDFDVLVPKADLERIETTLMMHGWSSAGQDPYDQRYYRTWMHELPPMRHISRQSVVDVHHALVPETARLRPDPARILAATVPCEGRPGVRVPSGTDLILHSAVHLFHDGEFDNALRDLFDIYDLVTHFVQSPAEWTRLIERARELELGRPLLYALRYLRRVLGVAVPAQATASLKEHSPGTTGLLLRDAMFERGLMPLHETCADWLTPAARFALYIRGHALRMPAQLLLPHLARKALLRSNLLPEAPRAR